MSQVTSTTGRARDRREIVRLAWPIVLANSAVPLLGIADTAVIGNTGSVEELGAIALGALVFSFVYWSFGFLRMGTTGFTAQASGAGDEAEVRATLGRALLLGTVIGVSLVFLQAPIARTALALLGAPTDVETLTRAYFDIRIWGAPASLGTFAILGSLVGMGRTGDVLKTQVLLNGLNIVLDLTFAGPLGLGVRGIALGTAISEWVTFAYGLLLIRGVLRERHADAEAFWPRSRILDRAKARHTLGANADIMVRTLFLLLGFAWFTRLGAGFGPDTLAANHVLLQLVSTSAYLLDGYAHATEIMVGRAVGARDAAAFDRAAAAASVLAAWSALGLAAAILLVGGTATRALTDLDTVRTVAHAHLPLTALYVSISFAAFQLDGIFIGATGTRAMRNASVLSCVAFIVVSLALVARLENLGLWIAFVVWVALRAGALGASYPQLRRSVADGSITG